MRLPSGLRFRLPLILFAAGAAFVATDSWIEARLALRQTGRTLLVHAASEAERAGTNLADAWFADPAHVDDYLAEIVASLPHTRFAGLVDGAGRLVACAPDSFVGAALDSLLGYPQRSASDRFVLESGADARMLRGDRVLAASPPLRGPRAGTRLVAVHDARPRLSTVARDINAQSIPGAALGVAIVLLIAWLLERRLHEPSVRLQRAAERIAAGDLAARTGLRGDDEIARAGTAFDRMADAVERTERALVAARGRLDGILRALPVGVGLVSRHQPRLLYANPRLRELTGADPGGAESLSRLLRRLRVRQLDGTPVPDGELAPARALASGQPESSSDLVLTHPDGEHIPFVSQAIPVSLSGGGAFDAVVAVVQDRRELLRLSEEVHLWKHRFERVVAATGQVVYEWDLETDTMMTSGNRTNVLGYEVPVCSESLAAWRERLHPEDSARAQERLAECLRTGAPFDEEYRLRHGEGRWIVVRERGFFDVGPEGRPVRMYGTMSDVTHEKEIEAHLLQAQKMETIGTLAGGVAHDFNNQLTGVIGHLDLLHDTLPPGDGSLEHLRVARAAAQRCADLTRGLLAFSRRIDSRPQPASLEALVDETAKLLRRALPVTVRLDTEMAASLPPALIDAGQIQAVLLNLCLNASDAMPAGGRVRVTTRGAGVGVPEGFVEMAVSDTGTGIAADVLPRIFEPFFTTKPVGKGTGLGLSMAYGIVSKHGGRIEVESRPGEGARFRVLLPAAPPAAGPPPAPLEPAPAAPALPRPGHGEWVLVVDDEPVVRTLAARALESGGFRALTAAGADEAEALLRARAGDVGAVLLDVMMPGRTGPEALPALRRIRPGLPVVLTSGFSSAGAPEDDPDTSFLSKPFSPLALVEAVRAALAGAGASRT